MLTTRRIPRLILAAAITAAPLTLAGCNVMPPLHEQIASFNVPHESTTALKVTTRNGAVDVLTWSGADVAITAHLRMMTPERLEQTTISAERTEAGVLVVEAIPPGNAWESREGCSFAIKLPTGASGTGTAIQNVEIRTGNGRISLAGTSGEAVLVTSNGKITVSDHLGPVSASTSNGQISIRHAIGPVKAHTSNGAVRAELAEGCRGPLDIKTSNGSVNVDLPRTFAGKLELRTSNGALRIADGLGKVSKTGKRTATVHLSDAGAPSAPTSTIRTSNGSITVKSAEDQG